MTSLSFQLWLLSCTFRVRVRVEVMVGVRVGVGVSLTHLAPQHLTSAGREVVRCRRAAPLVGVIIDIDLGAVEGGGPIEHRVLVVLILTEE